MHKVDWLDRLTFREIEMVNEVCVCVEVKAVYSGFVVHKDLFVVM